MRRVNEAKYAGAYQRLPWSGVAALLAMGGAVCAGESGPTVTTVDDVVDFGGSQMIDDLPGPDGAVSFREAVMAVNNTPGEHTIGFNIPTDEWWLMDDRALLRLEDGAFVITRDGTTVDGTTQTDFTGDTNPDGWEVGMYGLQPNGWGSPALIIDADDCVVQGLDRVMQRGYAVDIRGHNNRVINNTISGPLHAGVRIGGGFGGQPATGNVIGGTEPDEGNRLSGGGSGVRIEAPAEDNVVIGNHISGGDIGVWIIGSQYTDHARHNRVGGPTPEERNVIAGAGSYCCEGAPSGGQVKLDYAENNTVEGNYIGLTPDGNSGEGQLGPYGVDMLHSPGNTIRNNVIGDIRAIGVNHHAGEVFGVGIAIRGESSGNVVQGNVLGLSADETVALPNHRGIVITPLQGTPDNQLIGGTAVGEGNTIWHSDRAGVSVSSVDGVTISGNSIFSNGEQGIVLSAGANGNQSAPMLTEAIADDSSVTVAGTQSGQPGETHRIEVFANAQCDPSGFGEGERFLGYAQVPVTGPDTPFELMLTADVGDGEVLTATSTRLATGETSSFSACIEIEQDGGIAGDLNGDGMVNGADLGVLLGAWGACGDCESCNADLNGDCAVNGADLGILLGNWT